MNRAPFQLVDSRGPLGRLSAVRDHHQRKGANHGVRRIRCQWQESGGLCRQQTETARVRGGAARLPGGTPCPGAADPTGTDARGVGGGESAEVSGGDVEATARCPDPRGAPE